VLAQRSQFDDGDVADAVERFARFGASASKTEHGPALKPFDWFLV
jgi:hypothetical protein